MDWTRFRFEYRLRLDALTAGLIRIEASRLGHCAKLVFHLWVFWSYWRHEARHRAGSDPCREVCGGRSRVGRAQSPPVGGGRVARHRLRRRRGGFVGYRCGSGDDSQGAPGDCPRRGADGPHSTPWPKFNSRSTKQRGISNLQRQKRLSGTTNLRKPGNGSVRWLSCGRLPVAGRRRARRRWPAVRVRPAWRCARAGCARRGAGRWR